MLLERFGLTSHAHLEYTKISGGRSAGSRWRARSIHEPRLLILDEPTAGVDVELRLELGQWLRALNADGLTIFLTTHYLEEAEELCRRIAIIRQRPHRRGEADRGARSPTAPRCRTSSWS